MRGSVAQRVTVVAMTRPDRVANWSVWDPSVEAFVKRNYDSVRINVHTEDPERLAVYERFTERSTMTLGEEIDRTDALGLELHIVLDFWFGNGRSEDGGSPTQAGRYHETWDEAKEKWVPWTAEGGVKDGIDRLFSWLPVDKVLSISLPNEPKDWMAAFLSSVLPHLKAKVKGRFPIIGYTGEFLTPAYSPFVDAWDIHAVNSINGLAAARVKQARSAGGGRPVYMMEFAAEEPSDTQRELELLMDTSPVAIGGFPGSSTFPLANHVDWNFNRRSQFNDNYEGGITVAGEARQALLGDEGPVDPPIDPPDPPLPSPGSPETVADAQWVLKRVKKHGACMNGKNPTPPTRQENCITRLEDIIKRES